MTIDEIKRTVRLCRSGAFAVERLEKALAGLHAVAVYVSFDFHYSTGDGARFKIDLPLTDKAYDQDAARAAEWARGAGNVGDKRMEVIKAIIAEFKVQPSLELNDSWVHSLRYGSDLQTGWIKFLIGDDVVLIVRNAPLPFKIEIQEEKIVLAVTDKAKIPAANVAISY